MTVWELKKIASKRFRISPLRLELKRSDLKKPAFTDTNNVKLLKELKVDSYEII